MPRCYCERSAPRRIVLCETADLHCPVALRAASRPAATLPQAHVNESLEHAKAPRVSFGMCDWMKAARQVLVGWYKGESRSEKSGDETGKTRGTKAARLSIGRHCKRPAFSALHETLFNRVYNAQRFGVSCDMFASC